MFGSRGAAAYLAAARRASIAAGGSGHAMRMSDTVGVRSAARRKQMLARAAMRPGDGHYASSVSIPLMSRMMGLGTADDGGVPGSYVDAAGTVHYPPVSVTMADATKKGMSTLQKTLLIGGGVLAAGAALGLFKWRGR